MRVSFSQQDLMSCLAKAISVIDRKQTMPILANFLFAVRDNQAEITATDLEMEITTSIPCQADGEGEFTISGKKIFDICKSLPPEATLNLNVKPTTVLVKSLESSFSLSILPAVDYPVNTAIETSHSFEIEEQILLHLIQRTAFSIAQQDVRYYLNGLLVETSNGIIRAISTDGHRLAYCEQSFTDASGGHAKALIPRKAILELAKILEDSPEMVGVDLADGQIRIRKKGTTLTSKLIDGKFPDYQRVIPKNLDKVIYLERDSFKQALSRVAVLTYEKYRAVNLSLEAGTLLLESRNPEQEKAEEKIPVDYQGEPLGIGFNVIYLLDVLNVLGTDQIQLELLDTNSSAILRGKGESDCLYVVMPMRI